MTDTREIGRDHWWREREREKTQLESRKDNKKSRKTYSAPVPGTPSAQTADKAIWQKKTKKNTIKLNEESSRNALYKGRNQKMNDNGINSNIVNSAKKNIPAPFGTPETIATRQPRKFANRLAT